MSQLSGPACVTWQVWRAWHGVQAADKSWQQLKNKGLAGVTVKGELTMPERVKAEARSILLDTASSHHGSRIWIEGGKLCGFKVSSMPCVEQLCGVGYACEIYALSLQGSPSS